jgi:hypothetical protein
MKKFILLSLASLAIASVASATPISTCGVLLSPNSSTILITSSCSATADTGDFINSLTLTITDDFTGAVGTPTVTYTGTFSQSSPVFSPPSTLCAVTTSGINSVACSIGPTTVNGLDLSSYSISIPTASNGVTGGSISGASISLALSFTESPITGTPEPATLGLTGMALLGVGFLARRKGKARV